MLYERVHNYSSFGTFQNNNEVKEFHVRMDTELGKMNDPNGKYVEFQLNKIFSSIQCDFCRSSTRMF